MLKVVNLLYRFSVLMLVWSSKCSTKFFSFSMFFSSLLLSQTRINVGFCFLSISSICPAQIRCSSLFSFVWLISRYVCPSIENLTGVTWSEKRRTSFTSFKTFSFSTWINFKIKTIVSKISDAHCQHHCRRSIEQLSIIRFETNDHFVVFIDFCFLGNFSIKHVVLLIQR